MQTAEKKYWQLMENIGPFCLKCTYRVRALRSHKNSSKLTQWNYFVVILSFICRLLLKYIIFYEHNKVKNHQEHHKKL